jgi:DNA-binding MarR family transcriptional regulator
MQVISRQFGLKPGWLDVLSALRRRIPVHAMPATELARSVLLSSGGMTLRLDRMVEAGLVIRVPDPTDRRGVLVELTAHGRDVIDAAIDAHLELYEHLTAPLTKTEQETFIRLVRKQTTALESSPSPTNDDHRR